MKVLSLTEAQVQALTQFEADRLIFTERGIYYDNGQKLVLYDGLSHENFDASLLKATAPAIEYNGQQYINITEQKHYVAIDGAWVSLTPDRYSDAEIRKLIQQNTNNINQNKYSIRTNTNNITTNGNNINRLFNEKQDNLVPGYAIEIDTTKNNTINYTGKRIGYIENQEAPTTAQNNEDAMWLVYNPGVDKTRYGFHIDLINGKASVKTWKRGFNSYKNQGQFETKTDYKSWDYTQVLTQDVDGMTFEYDGINNMKINIEGDYAFTMYIEHSVVTFDINCRECTCGFAFFNGSVNLTCTDIKMMRNINGYQDETGFMTIGYHNGGNASGAINAVFNGDCQVNASTIDNIHSALFRVRGNYIVNITLNDNFKALMGMYYGPFLLTTYYGVSQITLTMNGNSTIITPVIDHYFARAIDYAASYMTDEQETSETLKRSKFIMNDNSKIIINTNSRQCGAALAKVSVATTTRDGTHYISTKKVLDIILNNNASIVIGTANQLISNDYNGHKGIDGNFWFSNVLGEIEIIRAARGVTFTMNHNSSVTLNGQLVRFFGGFVNLNNFIEVNLNDDCTITMNECEGRQPQYNYSTFINYGKWEESPRNGRFRQKTLPNYKTTVNDNRNTKTKLTSTCITAKTNDAVNYPEEQFILEYNPAGEKDLYIEEFNQTIKVIDATYPTEENQNT